MHGWKDCPECKGKGFRSVPRGVASCHTQPVRLALTNIGGQLITKAEADKMVGG